MKKYLFGFAAFMALSIPASAFDLVFSWGIAGSNTRCNVQVDIVQGQAPVFTFTSMPNNPSALAACKAIIHQH